MMISNQQMQNFLIFKKIFDVSNRYSTGVSRVKGFRSCKTVKFAKGHLKLK